MSLKSDILSAYGTCDYLDSHYTENLRQLFEDELARTVLQNKGKKEAEAFIESCLLGTPNLEVLEEQKLPDSDRSVVFDEFAWLDHDFQKQNPAFPDLNQTLLRRIYEQLGSDLSFLDEAASIEDQTAAEHPSAEKDAAASSQKEENARLQREALEKDLEELNGLTGLEAVKSEVQDLIAFNRMCALRKSRGLKIRPVSHHLLFEGNPGTGKTTVARLLGKIYKDMGILSKGHFVETSRGDLVAGYIGQTAEKTKKVLDQARGGILFIDEAYSLAKDSPNDFGKEAIETILKDMEDNREDLIVVAAGYPDLMEKFLNSNPGLRSRFNTVLHFENYQADELMSILESMCEDWDYTLDDQAKELMKKEFEAAAANPPADFGNARYVRSRLEKAIMNQARRLFDQSELDEAALSILTAEDFARLA